VLPEFALALRKFFSWAIEVKVFMGETFEGETGTVVLLIV
jgi:hypothetical protein